MGLYIAQGQGQMPQDGEGVIEGGRALTSDLFKVRSNLRPYTFIWEKN